MAPLRAVAAAHPGGLVDLSVGTPVDPTPAGVQVALAAAADAPGYPVTAGTARLRAAAVEWLARRTGAHLPTDAVLPTVGSKELVALLPSLLGVGDRIVSFPELAYPTYEVGARLAGAQPVRTDDPTSLDPARVGLVWLNSPANPTGAVLDVDRLRGVVDWAQRAGVPVASDECYIEFGWEAEPVSVLDPRVSRGGLGGLLAVHSLSKRSNLAGYRAGLIAGDPALVGRLLALRRHLGLMTAAPVQAAMVAAFDDDEHVAHQRARYGARRAALAAALAGAGFRLDASPAGLYLWVSRSEDCWASAGWFAEHGILVAPGDFYGPTGGRHVRVALTATDEQVAEAVRRLGTAAASAGAVPGADG